MFALQLPFGKEPYGVFRITALFYLTEMLHRAGQRKDLAGPGTSYRVGFFTTRSLFGNIPGKGSNLGVNILDGQSNGFGAL